jgi:hypothetical protein
MKPNIGLLCWLKESGPEDQLNGSFDSQMDPERRSGKGPESMGNFWESLSISLWKYATVFQAEIYAILDCVYQIKTQVRPENYVSICCDIQAAL